MVVEGPVEAEQGLVAPEEPDVGGVGDPARDGLGAGVEGRPLGLPGGEQAKGGGLVGDGHHPVLEGAGVVGDGALGVLGQAPAPPGDGLAQLVALQQRAVEVLDEGGGGDHVDAVAHGHHPPDPGVDHLLGQRPVGPDPGVQVGGRLGVGLRGGGGLGVGRAAGVEHQHRHRGVGQQPAEGGAVDVLDPGVGVGALEGQVAVGPGPEGRQRRVAPRVVVGVLGFAGGQVGPGAVAVEVHDVVGPAVLLRRLEPGGHGRVGGRAQHVELERRQAAAQLDEVAGHGAERHVASAPRPADHQQHPQLRPRGRQDRSAGGPVVGPHERPGPQRHRLVGAGVAQQLPGQGRVARVGRHLHPGLVQAGAHPGPQVGRLAGEDRPEQRRSQLAQPRLRRRRQPGGGVEGELEVVLQVPAQLLPVGGVDGEDEPARRPLDDAAVVQRDIDGVGAAGLAAVRQPQRQHRSAPRMPEAAIRRAACHRLLRDTEHSLRSPDALRPAQTCR